jgi:hypothetical protein
MRSSSFSISTRSSSWPERIIDQRSTNPDGPTRDAGFVV